MTIGPFPDLSTTKGAPNPTRPGRDYKGDFSEIADGAALYRQPTRKAKSRVRYLACAGRIFKEEKDAGVFRARLPSIVISPARISSHRHDRA